MYLILFLVLTSIIYILILVFKGKNLFGINPQNIKGILKLSKYLDELKKRKILLVDNKLISSENIAIASILLFVFSIVLFNLVVGVLSTSIILSIPVLISPVIISKILIKRNKQKILSSLPLYAVNLKNYITEENNIIAAIMKASVDEPLKIFIDRFKNNVSRGMNVIEALDILSSDVGVKEFTDLTTGIKLCYLNGGDFVSVLEKYISIITKESMYKEEAQEKAFSSVLTLIIMIILNVAVALFILSNKDYSNIIRTTFIGKMILNFNAISYMLIAVLMWKIYKEE